MPTPIEMNGAVITAGESQRVELPVANLPTHTMITLPVTVVHGRRQGVKLWLSATLHGDELNGMEIIRRVLDRIDPEALRGTVFAAPIVNVFGFIYQSRYLPDRRDLNRHFPGSRTGSLAARLARLFMTEIVDRCTHGIDLHTAAPPRANLPQIRGDLTDPETRACARAFGAPITMRGAAPKGSLRGAATARGATVLLYEAGEPYRFDEEAIQLGVEGVLRVMARLRMIPWAGIPKAPVSLQSEKSRWVRAPQSGVFYADCAMGRRVRQGASLGRISDPLGESTIPLVAPTSGLVVGLTTGPLVHRGDAVVHIASIDKPVRRRAE